MSSVKRKISVLEQDGEICSYDIYSYGEHDSYISMISKDGDRKNFVGEDLYGSFRFLRAHFEKNGAKVLCNGSRFDAYPSRMSRSMGGGKKIYILTKGEQARFNDLVDLFDYADPENIGSVQDQENYFEEWVSSLGE